MARFDLNSYATVGERLAQFHTDYPDGRIITEWENNFWPEEGGKQNWVVKATVYLSAGDQANKLPKATGYANEIDGSGGANNVAALPNAETSAIGRALMVMGYSMNKDPKTLASRQEMEKVERSFKRDFVGEASRIGDVEGLRMLYAQAKAAGEPADVLEKVKARAENLGADSKDSGTGAGVSSSSKGGAKK
jgi:hypothetical protein